MVELLGSVYSAVSANSINICSGNENSVLL